MLYPLLSTLFMFVTAGFTLAQSLAVSDNHRYLVQEDGTPFFWLGDTAWELFHRLDREEAQRYLQDRADKGFTVIQAVVLAELDGLTVPNPYGATPLVNNDPTQPNEAYFEHVDFIVNEAQARGLYVGMLPTWGDKFNKKWGVGPEIFTPENAKAFGAFLGKRYREKPIVWILGGDRSPEEGEDFAIVRAMAQGLSAGDQGAHLMTYHPQGDHNSADFFHEDAWLDFNMFQSGHGSRNKANYRWTEANYQLTPTKPTLDGEPCYEDHPIDWKPENGWFDAYDVRKLAYWSMLSGALGHTYGNHNIWQMWQPGRTPISSARTPWQEALSHPGAEQMGYLRRLFESRPFTTLIPDTALVVATEETLPVRAARGEGFLLAYLPQPTSLRVDLTKLSGKKAKIWWFDPRTGDSVSAGTVASEGQYSLNTPEAQQDWVLVIDDPAQKYPMPATEIFNNRTR